MSHVWILQGLSTLIKPYFAAPRGKLFDTLLFLNAVHLLLRGWLFIPFQKILPSGLDIILSIRRPTEIQLDRNLRLKSKTYSNRPYRSRPLGLAFFCIVPEIPPEMDFVSRRPPISNVTGISIGWYQGADLSYTICHPSTICNVSFTYDVRM